MKGRRTYTNPLCIHKNRKYRCRKCKALGLKGFGNGLCLHNKQRGQCAKCRDLYGDGLGTFFCPESLSQIRRCHHCKEQRKINRDRAFASAQGLSSTEFLENEIGEAENDDLEDEIGEA